MKFITYLLLFIAGLLYLYGVGDAIYISFKCGNEACNPEIPAGLESIILIIGGILGTHFGHIIGLPAIKLQSRLRFKSLDTPTNFQMIAVYIYLVALVGALVSWAIKGFDEEANTIVPILVEMAKTFIGVIAGFLAIRLKND